MYYFVDREKWLRSKVIKELRDRYDLLFAPSWKKLLTGLKDYLFDRRRWWLILIFVVTFFVFGGLVDIEFLKFIKVEGETARALVDRRTANIAGITSITLVVVGFLINNLAVKESFAYRLLFKHSYLFPITYFALSTIACFFIASTLRDELGEERFVNVVLAGTYLALVILLLVGFLFKRIIDFTNYKTIRTLLHRELMMEASKNLRLALINRHSERVYCETLNQMGIEEYSWAEALGTSGFVYKGSLTEVDQSKKEKLLHNVNLKRLRKFVQTKKKDSNKLLYEKLHLGKVVSEIDDFILVKDQQNSKMERRYLRGSIILKRMRKDSPGEESVRQYFDQKLEFFVKNDDYRDLEEILDSYYELYELQMKHQVFEYVG